MKNNTAPNNNFTHNGTNYTVWVSEGFKDQQIVHVYNLEDRKSAVVGTTFGPMASFEKDIMPWAKKCIAKNF